MLWTVWMDQSFTQAVNGDDLVLWIPEEVRKREAGPI